MNKVIFFAFFVISCNGFSQQSNEVIVFNTFIKIFETINDNDYSKTKLLIDENKMKNVVKYKTDLNYLIKLNKKIDYKDLDYKITKNDNNDSYKLWTRFKTGYSLDFEFEKINGTYVLVCVHP